MSTKSTHHILSSLTEHRQLHTLLRRLLDQLDQSGQDIRPRRRAVDRPDLRGCDLDPAGHRGSER